MCPVTEPISTQLYRNALTNDANPSNNSGETEKSKNRSNQRRLNRAILSRTQAIACSEKGLNFGPNFTELFVGGCQNSRELLNTGLYEQVWIDRMGLASVEMRSGHSALWITQWVKITKCTALRSCYEKNPPWHWRSWDHTVSYVCMMSCNTKRVLS